MIRGVILPASRSGIAAAVILGLGRALGEAIAVTQVIGNQTGPDGIHRSLFGPGDTLAEPHRQRLPGRDDEAADVDALLPRR